ncbi:putative Kinetochore Sim4 complex subunit FTA2-domain-containing protein [Seiridium cardinale]|uniref:Kinetochore Sim4 complex subunit FTA2-domain-containing protein n=1 Tax=Seiridium cardinale TaxID=138064 RepID=A0ABR2XXJ9_9PEZI
MSDRLNMIPLPDAKGPRLRPFSGQIESIQFLRLLSSELHVASGDGVPHSRVFHVRIKGQSYALKVVSRTEILPPPHSASRIISYKFNFFSLEELRPWVPLGEHLLKNKDKTIQHQLDPFFAECRAFGRLVEKGRDDELAVRCYGYVLLPETIERQIQEQFGIADWNRGREDEGQPLRAIIKYYIRYKTPFNRKPFAVMRKNIENLNGLGIYNMDIRKENYLGGRLFDFSIAITSPHLNLWSKLRFEHQIQEDMKYDLECLDEIADEAKQQQIKDRVISKEYNLRRISGRTRGK